MEMKDKLKHEILLWLAEFGREWVDLERYQQQPHSFMHIQTYDMLDTDDDENRITFMRLRLNDRAIAFLEGYENLKNLTKV